MNRLQIATRLHFVLLRELGRGIDVGKMLKRDVYARDVLLVCDAHGDPELSRLAQAFRGATDDAGQPTASTMAWRESQFVAAEASGFGASRPMTAHAPVTTPAESRTWFDRLLS